MKLMGGLGEVSMMIVTLSTGLCQKKSLNVDVLCCENVHAKLGKGERMRIRNGLSKNDKSVVQMGWLSYLDVYSPDSMHVLPRCLIY